MRLAVITVAILGIIGLWWAYPTDSFTKTDSRPEKSEWVEYVSDGAVRYFPEPWP